MSFRLTRPQNSGDPWQFDYLFDLSGLKWMNEDGDVVAGVYSVLVWPAGYNRVFDLGTLYGAGELARGNLISGRDADGWVWVAGEVGFMEGTFLFHYRIGGDPSSPSDLQKSLMPGLGDPTKTGACGINELGHVCGEAAQKSRGGSWHAIVYRPETNTVTDLGTLGGGGSNARDINDFDDAVGQAATKTGSSRFLWTNGVMWDLAQLIDPDENGQLPDGMFGHYSGYSGFRINNRLLISGPVQDGFRGFLLVPYTPQ